MPNDEFDLDKAVEEYSQQPSILDQVLSVIKRGEENVGQAVNQYLTDVSTATKPKGFLDDLLGFFKENIQKAGQTQAELGEIGRKIARQEKLTPEERQQLVSGTSFIAGVTSPTPARLPTEPSGTPIFDTIASALKRTEPPQVSPHLEDLPMEADRMAMEFAATRERPPIEFLAQRAQGGPLAETYLADQQRMTQLWKQAAGRLDRPGGAPPDPPSFSPNPNVTFQARDENLFDIIGTPASVMARTGNIDAYRAMAEIQLTEDSIQKGIAARTVNDAQALSQVTPRVAAGLWDVIEGKVVRPLSPEEASAVGYIKQKFASDKELIVQRLRDEVRPQIERQVRREMEQSGQELDEGAIRNEVARRQLQRVPEEWGVQDYLPHIFPGEYLIKNARGQVLASAKTKFQAKMMIRDLTEGGELSAGDLRVSNRTFVDADLLRDYRRSPASFVNELSKAAGLTREEIAAAAEGDFGPGMAGRNKFFSNLMKRGQSPGFTRDLGYAMRLYNRGLERWLQLSDLSDKIEPAIKELSAKGYNVAANNIKENLGALWGYRSELGQRFDNTLKAIPGVRDIVAPYAMERWLGGLKGGMVNALIKFSPRFHAVNATQIFTTLWPIADTREVLQGIRMWGSKAGKDILERYNVALSSRGGTSLGPIEDMNQGVAFLTMYNRAMKYGLEPRAAADYAILRGNIYSQFQSLVTDRPTLFRKFDPSGALTLFQRFGIKQIEQGLDLVRDRNVSGAAKWLATIGLMGGMRALTFGTEGYLTWQLYKEIKDKFGEPVANALHVGLPALAGVDLSNTAMVYNPPFGKSLPEQIGYGVMGPIGSISTSVIGAALNAKAPDPESGRRVLNALIQRLPVLKELDAVRRIIIDDYDIHSPDGKLQYKADVSDMFRRALGFRNVKEANLTLLSQAITDLKAKRDDVLDYAASRYGQARLSGVGLPKEMEDAIRKDVEAWNARWPEMPITGRDLAVRARARAQSAQQALQERLLKQVPKRARGMFSEPAGGGGIEEENY